VRIAKFILANQLSRRRAAAVLGVTVAVIVRCTDTLKVYERMTPEQQASIPWKRRSLTRGGVTKLETQDAFLLGMLQGEPQRPLAFLRQRLEAQFPGTWATAEALDCFTRRALKRHGYTELEVAADDSVHDANVWVDNEVGEAADEAAEVGEMVEGGANEEGRDADESELGNEEESGPEGEEGYEANDA
jgi:hypothetical protein